MKIQLLLFLLTISLASTYKVWDCMNCQQKISGSIREKCRDYYPGNYTAQQNCEQIYQEGVFALTSCLQQHGCFTTQNGYHSQCICSNCTLPDYTSNKPYRKYLKCLLDEDCGGDDRDECYGEILKSFYLMTVLFVLFLIF